MNTEPDKQTGPPPQFEWLRAPMVAAVSVRDFTTVYRLLQKIGFSQNRIAALTAQSQPEISAILNGRRVMSYDLIKRIVTGLQIPACLAGLGTCCCHDRCPTHRHSPPTASGLPSQPAPTEPNSDPAHRFFPTE